MTHVDPAVQQSGSVLGQPEDVQAHHVLGSPAEAEPEATSATFQLHSETALSGTKDQRQRGGRGRGRGRDVCREGARVKGACVMFF